MCFLLIFRKALSLQKEQQRSISLAKVKKQSNWFLHQEMLDAEEEDEEEDEDDEEDEDERDARSDSTAVTGPLRPPASRPSAQQAAVSVRGRKTLVTSGLSRLASLCGKSPSSPSSSASSSSSCSSSLSSSSCSSQVSRREEQTKTRSQEEEKAKAEAEKAKAEDENWTRKAESLDVHAFATAEDLEKNVHPEVLKKKLAMLGWKCGGRPAERAARLFLLKSLNGKPPPKHVLAAKKDGGRN
ncbi:telomere stability carboxy-terminal protein [Toxoplasma gondii RUB]|uniref:Telomere stability carboxy-terminal protein n=1 Tax=Toxoplasma gondii RUB TaxID=935652 RepID=A0A086M5G5_TOXGO|nr:telomere stability carboxy-terminal protein [Toxoplasma gondii RUB]